MLTALDDHTPLPPTRLALGPDSEAPGLLAVGGRLTLARLEEAYRRGIFPWYSPGQPPLWWSPDPRMVLPVAEFEASRSLRKTLAKLRRGGSVEVRVDTAFRDVIGACADTPRHGRHGTWIVDEVLEAYCAWHAAGVAHSVETWADGELVGGLYGVNIGRMFYGESMYTHRTDASKIALAALVCLCREHGISLIDCQQHTAHLASLGAREMPRAAFEAHLARVITLPSVSDWAYHHSLWRHLDPEGAPPAATRASLRPPS